MESTNVLWEQTSQDQFISDISDNDWQSFVQHMTTVNQRNNINDTDTASIKTSQNDHSIKDKYILFPKKILGARSQLQLIEDFDERDDVSPHLDEGVGSNGRKQSRSERASNKMNHNGVSSHRKKSSSRSDASLLSRRMHV